MLRETICRAFHDRATTELGVHEVPGPGSEQRILEYDQCTTLKATDDAVPWCSAFANFVVHECGLMGTSSAAARSWLNWGERIEAPILGCIVVFDRHDAANPMAAHVAFCDHPDISNGIIRVIGGNQGDAVKVARYSVEKVLGYRAPVVTGGGR